MTEANWNSLKPVILYTGLIILPCAISAWFFDVPILNWVLSTKWAQSVLIWVLFSLFSGWAEAYYYDAKYRSNLIIKVNEHIIWNSFRFFVWFPLFIQDWKTGLCLAGLFPFIHDGKYYAMRRKLNSEIYKKGFWDNPSKGSNAILDLPLWLRTALFLVASYLIIHFNY